MEDKEDVVMVTKKRNSLFLFPEDFQFKDLAPAYPELYDYFMRICDQYPEDAGEEYMVMLIRQNLKDLTNNRKPMGHNREARYRMIFPYKRERVQFFVYPRIAEEESEIEEITKKISDFFKKKKIEHEILWDQMEFLKEEEEKK